MNKVDLFEINTITVEDSIIRATLSINPQSAIYKAHFPGNPITPGVTEIYFAKKILQKAFPDKKFTFQFSKQIKFVEVLRPDIQEVSVLINTSVETEKLIADIEISHEKTVFLKAKLTYRISE